MSNVQYKYTHLSMMQAASLSAQSQMRKLQLRLIEVCLTMKRFAIL